MFAKFKFSQSVRYAPRFILIFVVKDLISYIDTKFR